MVSEQVFAVLFGSFRFPSRRPLQLSWQSAERAAGVDVNTSFVRLGFKAVISIHGFGANYSGSTGHPIGS